MVPTPATESNHMPEYTIKIPATVYAQVHVDDSAPNPHNMYTTVDDAAVEFDIDDAIVTKLVHNYDNNTATETFVVGDERKQVLHYANESSWPIAEWLTNISEGS